jgi:hypothetical protein
MGYYPRNCDAGAHISRAIANIGSCGAEGKVHTTMSASLRTREAAVKVRTGARYEH